MALRNLPLRLTAGAFILNSGVEKLSLSDEAAAGLQAMAAEAFPQVKSMAPAEFGKLLATGEVALGSALLLPFVPRVLAGLGLTGFAGALLWLYHKTPGATIDGVRPTQHGIALAKDVFLLGIGLALTLDAFRKR